MWIDEEDNLEGNSLILLRGPHNSTALVISCLLEVIINTIYKNLVQLTLSEINALYVTKNYWKDVITGKMKEKRRFTSRQQL